MHHQGKRILIVEDDGALARVLIDKLSFAGFEVDRAEDGRSALARARAFSPDLVLLDLMLPECDGIELCQLLRRGRGTPVIMLTARSEKVDKLRGLEAGAREQHKAGRMELLVTSFEDFERKTRDQLARILGPGGFDPAEDIQAITVNRWPHGYGYEYNPLFDPDWPEAERPNVIGRKKFGRIAIANTDSGATAYTDVAIDQAYRAVQELVTA